MEERPENPLCTLTIGKFDNDATILRKLFRQLGWRLLEAGSRRDALKCLENVPVHVVLAQSDLAGWSWKNILHDLRSFGRPPQLIVTSPNADNSLWCEALNLGAFDVLIREPFDTTEVERVVASARRHFDFEIRDSVPKLARAAGQVS